MGQAKLGKFERLEERPEFESRIINVYTEVIRTPEGRTANWILAKHKGAAAVIPVDENGKILLVRQYRITADDYVLEIPAGGLEPGEDPYVCAIRELEEETGYIAGKMEKLCRAYSTIGFCDEQIHYYVATDLKPGKISLDPDEYVVVERYTPEEILDMIRREEIVDGKVFTGVMTYLQMKQMKNHE